MTQGTTQSNGEPSKEKHRQSLGYRMATNINYNRNSSELGVSASSWKGPKSYNCSNSEEINFKYFLVKHYDTVGDSHIFFTGSNIIFMLVTVFILYN